MNSRHVIATFLVCLGLLTSLSVRAQTQPSFVSPSESSAIDTKGARHLAGDYPGKRPPWIADAIKTVPPEYSYGDRQLGHQGSGVFRLVLDPSTGSVTKVIIIKSTGFSTLDYGASISLQKWRFKPGKWQQVDLPITFAMRPGTPWSPR